MLVEISIALILLSAIAGIVMVAIQEAIANGSLTYAGLAAFG